MGEEEGEGGRGGAPFHHLVGEERKGRKPGEEVNPEKEQQEAEEGKWTRGGEKERRREGRKNVGVDLD